MLPSAIPRQTELDGFESGKEQSWENTGVRLQRLAAQKQSL